MGQNRHPFVDVQTPRGDRQPPATFKCCAEISTHTEEMCSNTAPQGMQGKTFAAKIEERKKARKYSRRFHGDMHTKCSEELHTRQEYRNKLVRELSVIVTCSRVLSLDPVLLKPRTVPPKCMQSQNLSLNTSQPRHTQ